MKTQTVSQERVLHWVLPTIGHTYSHQQRVPLCGRAAYTCFQKALGLQTPSLALQHCHLTRPAGHSLHLNMLCSKDVMITCLYAHLLTGQDPMSDDTIVHQNALSGSQDGKAVPEFLF